MWWIVGVVAVVALVATYLTWLASRVDRLHDRAASAQAALEAHLDRRRVIAAGLADALERPEVLDAARSAAAASPEDRELAENDLTRTLRSLPYPPESPVLAEVGVASRRVALARQVHNDLTRDALAVRRRPLVRALRLDHRHPQPRYFDIDDPILTPPGAEPPAADGAAAVPGTDRAVAAAGAAPGATAVGGAAPGGTTVGGAAVGGTAVVAAAKPDSTDGSSPKAGGTLADGAAR